MSATPETLLARLGQVVIRWNDLENRIRSLLLILCGQHNYAHEILTANMGGNALSESLDTIGRELAPNEIKEEIAYCIKLFDTLREYRNYYIHSAESISLMHSGGGLGIKLSQVSSRRKLTYSEEIVDDEKLIWFIEQIWGAIVFADSLWRYMIHPSPSGIPIRPPLPERLRKPRQNAFDPETFEC